MSELELRTLKISDAPMLSALERECFSCPWSEESFLECLGNDRFYFVGLYDNDGLIGYGGLVTVLDEGDIVNVAVRADERDKGYGRTLLSALCKEAQRRGAISLHLEVRESNSPARHLYESFGFQTDGIRKNYYQRPLENAVLMTKKL